MIREMRNMAEYKAAKIEKDEYYGWWYQCPKCKCDLITQTARNFCPWCGEDLREDKTILPEIPFVVRWEEDA